MTQVSPEAQAGRFAIPSRLRRAAAIGRLREGVLFLFIGGSSALLYVALNVAFTWAGMRPSLSIVCTLLILTPATYLAQRRFTFQSDRKHIAAFPRYIGTQLVGNGVGLIAAEVFPSAVGSQPVLAFALIALVVAITNYSCLKFWAFRPTR